MSDTGFEIWNDWSKTSTGKGPGNGEYRGRADLEKRWRSFARDYDGPRTTIATIYFMARQLGWTDQAKSENGRIFRGDELLSTAAPQRRWLVEKWIPAAEVTMLGGDGGSGKT